MDEQFPPRGYIAEKSLVDGVHIFKPAPEKEEAAPVVDFKCPQCGAATAFSAADGGLKCSYCGYYEPPAVELVGKGAEEFEFKVETLQRAAHGWGTARTDLECGSCVAFTSLPPDSLAHTCPFCGSNRVLQRQGQPDMLRPRFLIPFKIDQQQVQTILRTWLGSSWMTPSALRQMGQDAEITAIYLPFWTFDARAHAAWRAEVGHTHTETYTVNGQTRTRSVTVWRWESGNLDEFFDDLLIHGTRRISQRLLKQVAAFNLNALAPYNPKFLAGLSAQAYDVLLESAWDEARSTMRERTRQLCHGQASSSQVRNFSMTLDFAEESWRYLLLPAYLAPYRYADQRFQVLVNGQSGAIAGQRPVDWTRVWLVIVMLLSPGLLLSLIGAILSLIIGPVLAIGGVILLIIGVVISIVLLVKAKGMDDV